MWTLIQRLFRELHRIIAIINTRLLLTVIFFVIITPIGLMKRLFEDPWPGHDSDDSAWLQVKPDGGRGRPF